MATPGLYVRDAVVDTGAGTVRVPVLLGGPAGAASASTVTVNYTTQQRVGGGRHGLHDQQRHA